MKIALQSSSAQITHKEEYLNPSLDLSEITQTSQRGVGESSQRLYEECFHSWNQQSPKEGGGSFYSCPPKTTHWELASRN
jgi:hypothetical protein